MDRLAVIAELRTIVGEFLKEEGLLLIDLAYRYEGRNLFLKIIIDRPEGGISIGECAHVNGQIEKILDEKDILQQRYILEVSSPGLDRPLSSREDFLRCINRRARFFLKEEILGRLELEGLIQAAGEDAVYIDVNGECVEVPLDKINKVKQVIDIH